MSKYADHLPLYRQSQILARSGIDLHRSTLADWVGKASFHLRPVVDCLAAELKRSGKLGMDETTVRVLEPGRGRTRTGYMWTMVRDERPWCGADPPGVVYRYAPGRGGKYGEKLLEGFSGTLQTDGYSGYNRLRRSDRPDGALTLAACWAHARRGLKEMFDSNGSPIAKAGLERIARLYAIEEKIRGEPPATRQAIRWTESAPLVNAFGVWLDEQRSRVSPRSRLGEKLTYIANQWGGLLVFLYDGRVEIDSNFVENLIRPVKLTAKNALFAGHDEGAAAWGRIASLIGTCKMNGVEPYAWLTTRWRRSPPATRNRASSNSCPGTSNRRQAEIQVGTPHRLRHSGGAVRSSFASTAAARCRRSCGGNRSNLARASRRTRRLACPGPRSGASLGVLGSVLRTTAIATAGARDRRPGHSPSHHASHECIGYRALRLRSPDGAPAEPAVTTPVTASRSALAPPM